MNYCNFQILFSIIIKNIRIIIIIEYIQQYFEDKQADNQVIIIYNCLIMLMNTNINKHN